jgi:hypothetical protein
MRDMTGGYRSRAHQGAYRKGYQSLATNARNPYGDARTYRGSITWARSFRRAWVHGRRDAEADLAASGADHAGPAQ